MGAVVAALALAACMLAACGGGSASPATLQVRQTQYGQVVTDAAGRSLYIYVDDHVDPTESECTGGCADDWPPLPAPVSGSLAGHGITAAVGSVVRPGGTRQLTLGGYPLYYFAGDLVAGDTRGEGIGGVWYLLTPAGDPIAFTDPVFDVAGPTIPTTLGVRSTSSGPVVTDAAGQTTYVRRSGDHTDACSDSWCVRDWPPLLTTSARPTAATGITGRVGTVRLADGTVQVTLDGHPLYLFSGDLAPGDARGEGIGGQWFVAGVDGAPTLAVPASNGPSTPVGPVLAPSLPPLDALVPGPSAAAYVAFTLEGDVDDGAPPGGCWLPVAARGPAAGSYRHDLYFPAGTSCDDGVWALDVELYDTPSAAATAHLHTRGVAYRYYDVVAVLAPGAPAAMAHVLAGVPGLHRLTDGNQTVSP